MMHFDLRVILADGDLRKVGRMCELAGLRVRFPFLDDDVVEFSGRIPPSLLIRRNRLRYFYKRALRGRLPQETLQKRKHGFGLPFSAFAAYKPFLELFCDTLAALKKRYYIQRNFLDELIDHTYRGNTSIYDCIIWELAVLELWLASRLGTENCTVVGSDLPRRISQ
jgi:asparagine synthase (glutamine-hydrolysing)